MKECSKTNSLIPDWFDLDKYRDAATANQVDWALNLSVRKLLMRFHRPSWIDCDFDLLTSKGFIRRTDVAEYYEEARMDVLDALRRDNGVGHGVVFSMPIYRAHLVAKSIQADTELRHNLALIEYNQIFHRAQSDGWSESEAALAKWYEDFYKTVGYDDVYPDWGEFSPHICVDLDAPDEKIVEGFKAWLSHKRTCLVEEGGESYQAPKKVGESQIARWYRTAVLPYLDLTIYARRSGVDIPLHVIGNAIYPNNVDIDTTEAVRKTTRPAVDHALRATRHLLYQGIRDEERGAAGKI